MKPIKTIAVLCSGGDSPGMNCAIRAVVRTAISMGLEAYGIQRGYAGLLENAFKKMNASSVGNIIQHGGTILQTSRCLEFLQEDTRQNAAQILKKNKIDALVVIGGDGSFKGAYALNCEHQIQVAGIPATIDNDIAGTHYTIGFDTAVGTAVEAVDKIRDTAHSHERTFIVEVMGRRSPAIALHVGVCTGAENIVLPSEDINHESIAADIKRGLHRGKNSSIIIAVEGKESGRSYKIQELLKNNHGIHAHVCILGHIQRGGTPSSLDRFIASRMGFRAVEGLVKNPTLSPFVTCYLNGETALVPLKECIRPKTEYHPDYVDLLKTLSI